MRYLRLASIFLGFSVLHCQSLAQQADLAEGDKDREILSLPPGEIVKTLSLSPMPELGSGRIDAILSRYYVESFGGIERWNEIESLRLSGSIELDGGIFGFAAVQKKPGFLKVSIISDRREIELGYDGVTAWQKLPGQESAEKMSDKEARRFVNSATFGSLLLYPYAEGKTIEYIDTVPLSNSICHRIRVSLDTGFDIDYYIDIRSYIEIKSVTVDRQFGDEITVFYEDYDLEYGIPIATKVVTWEGDEKTSELQIEAIKINSGVMPWMFRMPR